MNLKSLKKKPSKDVADSYLKFSIFWLNKEKYLKDGFIETLHWSSPLGHSLEILFGALLNKTTNYIQLFYSDIDKNYQLISLYYKIHLTKTLCNYGGERYWFICPAIINGKACNRRVGVLYKPSYGCPYLGCRHCYNLTYESSKLSGHMKKYGKPLSITDIEESRKQVKKRFYKGQSTKKQVKFLIKLNQFDAYHTAWCNNFMKRYGKK